MEGNKLTKRYKSIVGFIIGDNLLWGDVQCVGGVGEFGIRERGRLSRSNEILRLTRSLLYFSLSIFTLLLFYYLLL